MAVNRDDFIKKKFKEDKFISKQANDVFGKFEKSILNNKSDLADIQSIHKNNVINFNNKNNEKVNNNIQNHNQSDDVNNSYQINNKQNIDNTNRIENEKSENDKNNFNNQKYMNNVTDFGFYKKMNKFLSVAAVFLSVILIGAGTVLYNRKPETENIDIVTKYVSVKNEELKFGNEQVLKEHENELVKASLVGKKEVAIQLKSEFIKLYNLNLSPNKQYKVNNINKDVKDVFVGYIVNNKVPYVMLLMEDGSAECVQILYNSTEPTNNYEFDFSSQGRILGLYNVIGFEQKTRNYYNSTDVYYYINAIRNDGNRKEIELGEYNDWNDDSTNLYDKLNESYIKQYEEQKSNNLDNNKNSTINENNINNENSSKNKSTSNNAKDNEDNKDKDNKIKSNENKNTAATNNTENNSKDTSNLNSDSNIDYHMENGNLYKIDKSKNTRECIATGVNYIVRDNADGRLSVGLTEQYTINEIDSNIIYNEYDVNTGSSVVETMEKDGIQIELRENGSLILLISSGGLKKLGINSKETNIKENVRYNIYGKLEGVYNGQTQETNAWAKAFIIGDMGPNNVRSIVYAKRDNTIVCIDLKEAIKSSDLHLRKKNIYGVNNIQGFKEDSVYGVKDGKSTQLYKTIFVIQKNSDGTTGYRELSYGE